MGSQMRHTLKKDERCSILFPVTDCQERSVVRRVAPWVIGTMVLNIVATSTYMHAWCHSSVRTCIGYTNGPGKSGCAQGALDLIRALRRRELEPRRCECLVNCLGKVPHIASCHG